MSAPVDPAEVADVRRALEPVLLDRRVAGHHHRRAEPGRRGDQPGDVLVRPARRRAQDERAVAEPEPRAQLAPRASRRGARRPARTARRGRARRGCRGSARRRPPSRATASRSRPRARAARGTRNDSPFASRPACVSGCARQIRSWIVSTSGGPPGASAAVLPSACTRSDPGAPLRPRAAASARRPPAARACRRRPAARRPRGPRTTAPRAARPPARARRTRPSARSGRRRASSGTSARA